MDDFRILTDIDRVLHEPGRLIIVALLQPLATADFLFLLRESGLTRGNLSSHLSKLEAAGYIAVKKTFRGKIPQTLYRLTARGRKAFKTYRIQMKRAFDSFPE